MKAGITIQPTTDITSAEYLSERVIDCYKSLDVSSLGQLQSLYSEDVYFEDPSHAFQGRPALMRYFESMFENVDSCQFKFHQSINNGSDIFLSWTMLLRHKRLLKGEVIRVEGSSYLKTRNGSIYCQRDYFDMGAMVYEHIPVLRTVVRFIKQRLGNN